MTRRLLTWGAAGRRLDVELLFEPRDLFVGVFRDVRSIERPHAVERWAHIWLLLLPCLPLHITWHVGYDLAAEASIRVEQHERAVELAREYERGRVAMYRSAIGRGD